MNRKEVHVRVRGNTILQYSLATFGIVRHSRRREPAPGKPVQELPFAGQHIPREGFQQAMTGVVASENTELEKAENMDEKNRCR